MKKLLVIMVLGLLLSGIAYTAEFSTKTYVNCEPKFKDDWFKNIITDVKYISINPTVFYYDWHSNKKEFLKKSKKLKTWDYQYIIKINERWSGALFKWEELTIDRYTGTMNIQKWYRDPSKKETHVSSNREFQCEKIEKDDLPKIKAKKQKF